MLDQIMLFKAMADETRLRCLMLLAGAGELCVCELGYVLQDSQPKISRHLALLRKSEVVQDRRDGQWVYYRIHPNLPTWALTIIQGAVEGSREKDPFLSDRQRLAAIPDRGERCGVSFSRS